MTVFFKCIIRLPAKVLIVAVLQNGLDPSTRFAVITAGQWSHSKERALLVMTPSFVPSLFPWNTAYCNLKCSFIIV